MKMKVVSLSLPIRHIIFVFFTTLISFISAYSQKLNTPFILLPREQAISQLEKNGLKKMYAEIYVDSFLFQKNIKKTNAIPVKSFLTTTDNISSVCNNFAAWEQYRIGSIVQGSGNFVIGSSLGLIIPFGYPSTSALPPPSYNMACLQTIDWGSVSSLSNCSVPQAQTPMFELGFDPQPSIPGSAPFFGRLIRKTFHVDIQNCIFKYQFAFLSGGCGSYFSARVYDQNSNLIINTIKTPINSSLVSSISCSGLCNLKCFNVAPLPGCTAPNPCATGGPGLYDLCWYQNLCAIFGNSVKQFSTESLDLSAYYNQDVTIEFVNTPCSSGQHLHYSLIGGFCFCSNCDLSLATNTINTTCSFNNGSIDLVVTGGAPPLTYNWSNGSQSEDLSNVAPGSYTVIVTDANNCSATTTASVVKTAPDLSLTVFITNQSCTTNNGSIIAATSGGTMPFQYTIDGTNFQSAPTFTGLVAGNYTITVKDANGCTKTTTACVGNSQSDFSLSPSSITDYCGKGNGSATVSVVGNSGPYTYVWNTTPVKTTPTITGLLSGNYTVTVTDAFGCSKIAAISVGNSQSSINLNTSSSPENCNQHNGVAAVTASGGTAPYTYSWNTTPIKTTAAINGLSQGNYTVTVTDANNCSSVKTITINNITAPLLTETHLNTNCNKPNGSIDLTVTGGISPYTYSWSFGAGSQDVSNLTAGSYQVTVTDAGGCTATKNILIANFAGSVLTETHINITCGNPNGSIDLSVNGGTIPYTYLWSNGATSQDLNSITTPGTYSVVVIDANCCSATKTISISNTPCPDCCEGGSWTSKTIGWSNIINGNLLDLSTQKAIAKIPGLDLSSYTGPSTGLSNSINITKCDSTYHVSQNGTYTLDATYSCNPNLSGCIKDMKVKIDGPAHSGIYTSPVTQTFSIPGNYQIAYYAYCGGKLCDSCKFTLAVDINCCAGNSWVSKTYTKVNLDYSSSAPATLLGVFDNPVGLKPIIYAPKAVNVILNYACASGCGNATYKLLQKNNITGAIIVNTIITGNIASIYTYAATSRVWITPMCGGRTCGQPVIFDIKCNAPVCPAIISWPLPWSIGTTNIYNNTPLLGLKEIEEKLFPIATKNAAITQATISYNGGEYLLNVIYANKEGQKNDEIIIPLKIDDTGLLEMGEFFIRKNNDATNITTRIPDTSISANYKKNPFYVGHMALLK